MNPILIFGLGVGTGVVIGLLIAKSNKNDNFVNKQTREKAENKQKILDLMESGSEPMTNERVQQALGFSEASVTRYFDELEKEGRVRQVGQTGQGVYYEKAN